MTVDSGACDAIVPPRAFSNTPTAKHAEYGCTYKACGGEVVTNIRQKTAKCKFNEGFDKLVEFQVGDNITKGLLAVSKLAQSGAGVWFGRLQLTSLTLSGTLKLSWHHLDRKLR